jgi:hypothetical protein
MGMLETLISPSFRANYHPHPYHRAAIGVSVSATKLHHCLPFLVGFYEWLEDSSGIEILRSAIFPPTLTPVEVIHHR